MVPRSAVITALGETVIAEPIVERVIEPPGPGALALSRESNCAFAPTVIPVPVVKLLCSKIAPPLALRRIGGGGVVPGIGSLEETWIVSSTLTLPAEEISLTVPPAPEKPLLPLALLPVVAVILAPLLAVIFPLALTINVPPSPPEAGPPLGVK